MITFNTEISSGNSFNFPDFNDPYFQRVRVQNPIELEGLSEIEKIKKIANYVHTLFAHDGNRQAENPDPLWIIEQARQGNKFRCVEYASVTTALMGAYGIRARSIGLRTVDVETRESGAGHVVNEVWVSSLQKWTMIDVQENILFNSEDKFLSCVELLNILQENKSLKILSCDNTEISAQQFNTYKEWIQPYLYYFVIRNNISFPLENLTGIPSEQIMLVPIGAPEPKIFQRKSTINSLYTNNIKDFYPSL